MLLLFLLPLLAHAINIRSSITAYNQQLHAETGTSGFATGSATGNDIAATGSATGAVADATGASDQPKQSEPPTTMISQRFVIWGLSLQAAEADKKIVSIGIAASLGTDIDRIEITGLNEVASGSGGESDVIAAASTDRRRRRRRRRLLQNKKVQSVNPDGADEDGVEGGEEGDEKDGDGEGGEGENMDLRISFEVAVDEADKARVTGKMEASDTTAITSSINLAFKDNNGGTFGVEGLRVLSMETPIVEIKKVTASADKTEKTIEVVREQIRVVTKDVIQDLDNATQAAVAAASKPKVPGESLGIMNVIDGDDLMFDHDAAMALNVARKGSMDGISVEEEEKEENLEVADASGASSASGGEDTVATPPSADASTGGETDGSTGGATGTR